MRYTSQTVDIDTKMKTLPRPRSCADRLNPMLLDIERFRQQHNYRTKSGLQPDHGLGPPDRSCLRLGGGPNRVFAWDGKDATDAVGR